MTHDEILRLNPHLDLSRVRGYLDYVEGLRRAGIAVDPEYRITPPLSGPPREAPVQQLVAHAAAGRNQR